MGAAAVWAQLQCERGCSVGAVAVWAWLQCGLSVGTAAGGLDLVMDVWKTVRNVGSGSLLKGPRLEKGSVPFCLENPQNMISAL